MRLDRWLALAALLAIAAALWHLRAAEEGVAVRLVDVDGTPVTIFRPAAATGAPRPVVVIAHGFAGSQQLMQSFALTFARNGYVALTFDARGHGRNPRRLTGDIARLDGATQTLLGELRQVAGYARGLGDGRLVVLGHSMASDIVVRFAQSAPGVVATIAVSMFSPAVTAGSPRNLLVVVGEWEPMLVREALRAVGLAIAPVEAVAGVTYGDIALGSARRVAVSAHVEHASDLFSADSMREALDWLDRVSGTQRPVSLAIAVALDFERLFFLAIIVPVIVLFFVVYGLFSHWSFRQTGHPFVGAIASAVAFAWAIGVTFPLLAG